MTRRQFVQSTAASVATVDVLDQLLDKSYTPIKTAVAQHEQAAPVVAEPVKKKRKKYRRVVKRKTVVLRWWCDQHQRWHSFSACGSQPGSWWFHKLEPYENRRGW